MPENLWTQENFTNFIMRDPSMQNRLQIVQGEDYEIRDVKNDTLKWRN